MKFCFIIVVGFLMLFGVGCQESGQGEVESVEIESSTAVEEVAETTEQEKMLSDGLADLMRLRRESAARMKAEQAAGGNN